MSEADVVAILEERRPPERGWRRVEFFFSDPDTKNKRVRPHSIVCDIPHWGIPNMVRTIVHEQIEKARGPFLGVVSFDLPLNGEINGES